MDIKTQIIDHICTLRQKMSSTRQRAYVTHAKNAMHLLSEEAAKQIDDANSRIEKDNAAIRAELDSAKKDMCDILSAAFPHKKRNAIERMLNSCSYFYVKPHFDSYVIDGVEYRICGECSASACAREARAAYSKRESIAKEQSALLTAAIKLAVTKYSDIDLSASHTSIIDTVTAREIEKYIESRNGEEMNCECDECNTWTVGERRCNCGNRRFSLTVEGDIVNGFTGYPEAY